MEGRKKNLGLSSTPKQPKSKVEIWLAKWTTKGKAQSNVQIWTVAEQCIQKRWTLPHL